jgi:four helix bundle protein
MATYSSFYELPIWQESRILFKEMYALVVASPAIKDFRFRDQICASGGSVMDNIAEGFERSGNMEFNNFLSIAKGSSGEVRSQLFRGIDMQYFKEADATPIIEKYTILAASIAGFMDYLNRSSYRGQKFKNRT